MPKPVSENWLAEQTGLDRRTIKKHVKAVGLDYTAGKTKLLAVLNAVKEQLNAGKEQAYDPETGLSWFTALQREKTIETRRANEIAEKLLSKEYMKTEDVVKQFTAMCNSFENLSAKAKSELGLSEEQRIRLQKMIDECRSQGAIAMGETQ